MPEDSNPRPNPSPVSGPPSEDAITNGADVILGSDADEDDGAATTAAPTVSVTTAAATIASPRHAQPPPVWPHWTEMFSLLASLLKRQFGNFCLKPTRDDEARGLPLVVLDAETDFEVVYSSTSLGRSTGWTKAALTGRRGLDWLQLTCTQVHDAVNGEACESLARQQQQLKAHLSSGKTKPNPAAELMMVLTPSGKPVWTMLLSVPVPLPSTGSLRSRYLVVAVITLGARVPYHVFCGLRPRVAVAKGLMDIAREDLLSALSEAGLGETAVGPEDLANFDLEAEILAEAEGRGVQGTLMKAVESLRRNMLHLHEDACEAPHYMPKLGWSCVETFDVLHSAHKVVSQVHKDQLTTWRIPREDQNYQQLKPRSENHGGCCCWLDPTGIENPIVYLSPGFEQLTGYQRVWAMGRSIRFLQPRRWCLNGSEDTLFQEFVEDPATSGHLLTLFLHERADGKHFWNVVLAERFHFTDSLGRRDPGLKYIGLSMMNVVVEREVLDMVVQEEIAGRGSGERQLETFRSMLRERDATFQDRSKRGIQTLLRQVSQEWFLSVSHGMGVGRLLRWAPGSNFIEDFSSNWPKLMEKATPFVQEVLGLTSFDGSQSAEDCPFLACVSNSALVDCPVVFMTKAFRETFEYRDSHQVLGSNWRFFQPMKRELPLTEAFYDLDGLLEGRSVARPQTRTAATPNDAGSELSRCLVLLQRRLGERVWTLSTAKPFVLDNTTFILRLFVPLSNVQMPDWMCSHSEEEAQQAIECSARLVKPLKLYVESCQQKGDVRSLEEVSEEVTKGLNDLLRPYREVEDGKEHIDKQDDNDDCQTVVPENEEVELTINGRAASKRSHHRPSEASLAPLTAVATCCSSPTASRTEEAGEASPTRASSPTSLPPIRRVRRAHTGGVSVLHLTSDLGSGSSSASSRPALENLRRGMTPQGGDSAGAGTSKAATNAGAATDTAVANSEKLLAAMAMPSPPSSASPTSSVSGARELQRRIRRANTDRFATVEEEVLRPLSLPPLALNSMATRTQDLAASPPSSSSTSPPAGAASSPLASGAVPRPPADPRPDRRFQRFNRGSSGAAAPVDVSENLPTGGSEDDEPVLPNQELEPSPLPDEDKVLIDAGDACLRKPEDSSDCDCKAGEAAEGLQTDGSKASLLAEEGAGDDAVAKVAMEEKEQNEEQAKEQNQDLNKARDRDHGQGQNQDQNGRGEAMSEELLSQNSARDSQLTGVPCTMTGADVSVLAELGSDDPTVEAATRIAAMALPKGDVAIAHAVQGLKDRGWSTSQICELFKFEPLVIESMLAERDQQE